MSLGEITKKKQTCTEGIADLTTGNGWVGCTSFQTSKQKAERTKTKKEIQQSCDTPQPHYSYGIHNFGRYPVTQMDCVYIYIYLYIS